MLFDCEENFSIQKYGHGVELHNSHKLIATPPETQNKSLPKDVIFKLPFNVYFLNKEGVIEDANDTTIETHAFVSKKDAIGRSVREIAKPGTADLIFENNEVIFRSEMPRAFDEEHVRLDGFSFQRMSIKFPWYENGKVRGIFGISIPINGPSAKPVSASLTQIFGLDLFQKDPPQIFSSISKRCIGRVTLTEREALCLRLLMRGKTAKVIARELNLSPRTIENYINNIKTKFGVTYKSELIDAAYSQLGPVT